MIGDVFAEILAWLSDASTQWFLAYWALLALLAGIESAMPAFEQPPQREARWPTNLGLGIINMSIAPLAPVSMVAAAQWAQSQRLGLFNLIDAPWALISIATLAVASLTGYLLHLLMHQLPLFWMMHRVHHSDLHLDVSTSLRSHPLEFVVNLVVLAAVATAFGLDTPTLAAYAFADSIVNLLGHANLRLPEPIDRPLRLLFVTPNMHCLHHSSYQPETDSNYGQLFSVWDRLFGTYSAAPRAGYGGMQIGLEEIRDGRASDLWWQFKSPLISIERSATRAAEKPLAADRPLPAEQA